MPSVYGSSVQSLTGGTWTNLTNANGAPDAIYATITPEVDLPTVRWTCDLSAVTSLPNVALHAYCVNSGTSDIQIAVVTYEAAEQEPILDVEIYASLRETAGSTPISLGSLSIAQAQSVRSIKIVIPDAQEANDGTLYLDALAVTYYPPRLSADRLSTSRLESTRLSLDQL